MEVKLAETPIVKIDDIYFKLEYKNPTGSVKDRGVLYQINQASKLGYKNFVISSSGNAAISASYWVKKYGGNLITFVSPKINKKKLTKLEAGGGIVIKHDRAISSAIKFAKENKAFNLRASMDDNGYLGYKSLSLELNKQIGKIGSIFVPVSSGTLLYGVTLGFEELKYLPQLYAVQTTAVNLIAKKFDRDFKKSGVSIADALVARVSPLKAKVIAMIEKSNGSGLVVSDEEIKRAWFYLKDKKIITSYEGAATLAAFRKAKSKGIEPKSPIVCLLTGIYYD